MAATFKITHQRMTNVIGTNGMTVPSLEVTYETIPEAIVGTVNIPMSQATAEVVGHAIEQQVATHQAIANL